MVEKATHRSKPIEALPNVPIAQFGSKLLTSSDANVCSMARQAMKAAYLANIKDNEDPFSNKFPKVIEGVNIPYFPVEVADYAKLKKECGATDEKWASILLVLDTIAAKHNLKVAGETPLSSIVPSDHKPAVMPKKKLIIPSLPLPKTRDEHSEEEQPKKKARVSKPAIGTASQFILLEAKEDNTFHPESGSEQEILSDRSGRDDERVSREEVSGGESDNEDSDGSTHHDSEHEEENEDEEENSHSEEYSSNEKGSFVSDDEHTSEDEDNSDDERKSDDGVLPSTEIFGDSSSSSSAEEPHGGRRDSKIGPRMSTPRPTRTTRSQAKVAKAQPKVAKGRVSQPPPSKQLRKRGNK